MCSHNLPNQTPWASNSKQIASGIDMNKNFPRVLKQGTLVDEAPYMTGKNLNRLY